MMTVIKIILEDEAINKECENFLNSLKGGEGQNVETD